MEVTMSRSIVVMMFAMSILPPQWLFGQQPNIDRIKQGFLTRLQWNNQGVLGKRAYDLFNPPADSILLGFEYPVGSQIEHLYGAGLWLSGPCRVYRVNVVTPACVTRQTVYAVIL
jgi:hypothetical protein